MFLILIMNFDKNIYNKILFVLFYVSILNKNNDLKLFILGYISSLFINWIKYYDLFYELIKINNNNIDINIDKQKLIEHELKDALQETIQ